MKKETWILVIMGIVIIILAGFLLVPSVPNEDNGDNNGNGNNNGSVPEQSIVVTTPQKDEEIVSPLRILGTVNGNGWAPFEAQAGTVKLLGENGEELAFGILTTVGEWMQLPASFETTLNFQSDRDQNGQLVFMNENASGDPERNKQFVLPVKIKASTAEMMQVKAFFSNNQLDPQVSCNKVFSVNRQVPKTTAAARAALSELLKGPTAGDESGGFYTSINTGVEIQSLRVENGTAYVDFSEQIETGVGGSCRVSAIRAQITETLKQFPTVNNVIISVDGRTEDILQP